LSNGVRVEVQVLLDAGEGVEDGGERGRALDGEGGGGAGGVGDLEVDVGELLADLDAGLLLGGLELDVVLLQEGLVEEEHDGVATTEAVLEVLDGAEGDELASTHDGDVGGDGGGLLHGVVVRIRAVVLSWSASCISDQSWRRL